MLILMVYGKRRDFSYSVIQWFKKLVMLPVYQYSLGPNSLIPNGIFAMLHIIVMNSVSPDPMTNKLRPVIVVILTLESGVAMYYFSGYEIRNTIGVMGFTLFFVFYILNLFQSLSELVERLEAQYLNYKNLVDFIHGVLITMDDNLIISYANKDLLNFKTGDLVGKNIQQYPFYDEKKIMLLKKTKERQSYYWKTIAPNGELFWFVIDATIQFSSLKNSEEIALLIHDVSLEKKIQEQEKINIENSASLKAKNEFIASISHEIRNPLQVISYSSENLLSKNLTLDVKQTIQDIDSSTKFLTTIIGDILDYSKIEAGEMKISEKKFDILSVVETAIRMNSKSCLEKALNMNLTFDYSLPKHIVGDSTRILQIMNNFITNAIKCTTKGNIQISITKNFNEENIDFLYFSCHDTGRGISKKNLEILFDPFIQIHHKKKYSPTQFKGWGLGLSICKKLLHLMKGEFGVESELHKGSKFWFKVPLVGIEGITMTYQEELKKLKLETKKLFIVHSDIQVVNQMVSMLKLIDVGVIVNPKTIKPEENQLIFVEKEKINTIPDNVDLNPIVEISNDTNSKFRTLSYPIIPTDLLQLISKVSDQPIEKSSTTINSNMRILIVDDNPLIMKSLEKLLQTLNIVDIQKALNGQEAVNLITENDEIFDIVFMDISMPVMNGIEATKMIRELKNEKKRNTIIYALTGNALTKSIGEQKLEWKMDDILTKPVNKNELQEVLQLVGV